MGVKAEAAVPKILMQNNLAVVIEAYMGDTKSIAYDFLADWREARSHGPN